MKIKTRIEIAESIEINRSRHEKAQSVVVVLLPWFLSRFLPTLHPRSLRSLTGLRKTTAVARAKAINSERSERAFKSPVDLGSAHEHDGLDRAVGLATISNTTTRIQLNHNHRHSFAFFRSTKFVVWRQPEVVGLFFAVASLF